MRLVFDLEANGLYDSADTIWCIVTKDIDTSEIVQYYGQTLSNGLDALEKAEMICGHNILDYDIRLLKKLYCYFTIKPDCLIFDTMILSQLLNPDRKGGHSLAQYGEEQGIKKPEHEDWSKFSPEMLHRCTQDVEINHKVYNYLIKEAYEPVEGIPYAEVFL